MVEAILQLVKSDDVFVRRYAIEILNSIPSERSVPALIDALNDQDWWVRERAIDALGKTRDSRAVDPLMTQMRADPQVANLVVGAMVKIGEGRALEALLECLQNRNVTIHEAGRSALRELARSAADLEVRKGAARALSQEGEGAEWGRAVSRSGEGTNPTAQPPGKPGQKSMTFHAVGATRIEALLPDADLGQRPGTPPGDPRVSDGQTKITPRDPRLPSDTSGMGPGDEPPRRPPSLRMDRSELEESTKITLIDLPKLPPGTLLLDRYVVIRKIGEGGFGYVYLVQDRSVGEEIILKILGPQISLDESMIKRFVHELKFNRRIVHPNVIRLYDFLELNPGHAISMEYFASVDLGTLLETEKTIDPARLIPMARQICHGLKAAHDSGIVHRDIKPQNVLIGEGDRVKIVDFGLAARSDTNLSRVTKSGILVGTPPYMSPEQIRGNEIDLRTDIYALGALLFECVTGNPPYMSSNPVQILMMHINDPIPSVRELVPGIPDVLEWLIQTALAKDPADRPQSTDDILVELEERAA
ncbi:MAG: protein kinase [Candidatus Eisenbacteria bacterium]